MQIIKKEVKTVINIKISTLDFYKAKKTFTNALDFNVFTAELEQGGIGYDCGVNSLGMYWIEY